MVFTQEIARHAIHPVKDAVAQEVTNVQSVILEWYWIINCLPAHLVIRYQVILLMKNQSVKIYAVMESLRQNNAMMVILIRVMDAANYAKLNMDLTVQSKINLVEKTFHRYSQFKR